MSQKLKQIILIAGDIIVLYVSLWLTLLVRYGTLPDAERWSQHVGPFTVVFIVWIVVLYVDGLYSIATSANSFGFFSRLTRAMLINASLGAVFFYLTPFVDISPKTNFVIAIVLTTVLIILWRQLNNHIIGSKTLQLNTIIIGEQQHIDELVKDLVNKPQLGFRIVKTLTPSDLLGNNEVNIRKIVEQYQAKIIAAEPVVLKSQTMIDQLFNMIRLKTRVIDLTQFIEEVTGKIPVRSIGQAWFIDNLDLSSQKTFEILKRLMDIVGSLLLLILLSWLIPIIMFIILITMGRPVFFMQTRMGYFGKTFRAVKFRSMIKNAEKSGPQWATKNDTRVTKFGRFLRKTRVDEIPQLINIIRGEMSFVGPRPERPEFVTSLKEKIPFYNERHLVKPGLTGWAQVSFPYGASEEDALEKLQYDLFYIKNRSLILDIAIILRTIKTILSAAGQ